MGRALGIDDQGKDVISHQGIATDLQDVGDPSHRGTSYTVFLAIVLRNK